MTETPRDPKAEQRREQAKRAIQYHTLGIGAAPFFIPSLLVDLVVAAGVQLNLVRSLARIYDQPFSDGLAKSLIAALVGASVPATAFGLFNAIPWLGILGASAGGAAATHAVGKVFAQHFESGGTFLTFDPEKVREHYYNELRSAQAPGNTPVAEQEDFGGVRP